jgi:hypothetical protein
MSPPPHRQQQQQRGTVEAAADAEKYAGWEAAQQDLLDNMAAPWLMWTDPSLEADTVELKRVVKRRGQTADDNNDSASGLE